MSDPFELPPNMAEDDVMVIHNILSALQSLGGDSATGGQPLCSRYKVLSTQTGYLLKAAMHATDLFEVSHEDFLYLQGINPARIESIAMGRSAQGGPCELLIRVLDAKQRVMIKSTTAIFSTARKCKKQRVN